MASRVVEGMRLPISVGGHPALDFCNTRAAWPSEQPKEYLVGHHQVAVWARENGLLTPAQARAARRAGDADPTAADDARRRTIAFRSALYEVLVGRPTARVRSWPAVSHECGAGAAAAELVRNPTGIRWELPRSTDPVLLPHLVVVRSATELLVSPGGGTVSACPMPDCGWVFANPTGRRRWCSMAWCGNRSKARRFAERARTRPAVA